MHSAVKEQIWSCYGRVLVDLFASRKNKWCVRFYSLQNVEARRCVCTGVQVATHAALRVPRPSTDTHTNTDIDCLILIAPYWPDLLSKVEGLIFHPHLKHLLLWAWLFRAEDLWKICAAANWSLLLTFVRFYLLDVLLPRSG